MKLNIKAIKRDMFWIALWLLLSFALHITLFPFSTCTYSHYNIEHHGFENIEGLMFFGLCAEYGFTELLLLSFTLFSSFAIITGIRIFFDIIIVRWFE